APAPIPGPGRRAPPVPTPRVGGPPVPTPRVGAPPPPGPPPPWPSPPGPPPPRPSPPGPPPPRPRVPAAPPSTRSRAPAPGQCPHWSHRDLPVEQRVVPDQRDQLLDPLAGLAVGEHERLAVAHRGGVPRHHRQVRPHVRRQVVLVEDREVRLGAPRPVLAGALVPGGPADREDEEVRQRGAEGEGEVVPAALDQHQVAVGEPGL